MDTCSQASLHVALNQARPMGCCGRNWVADIPYPLRFGLTPSRCHTELTRVLGCLKILDHRRFFVVFVAEVAIVEVDLNAVEVDTNIIFILFHTSGSPLWW